MTTTCPLKEDQITTSDTINTQDSPASVRLSIAAQILNATLFSVADKTADLDMDDSDQDGGGSPTTNEWPVAILGATAAFISDVHGEKEHSGASLLPEVLACQETPWEILRQRHPEPDLAMARRIIDVNDGRSLPRIAASPDAS
jgi:hypothetical protein